MMENQTNGLYGFCRCSRFLLPAGDLTVAAAAARGPGRSIPHANTFYSLILAYCFKKSDSMVNRI